MLTSTTPPALAVRGTVAVCRELGIPAWLLERVIREEAMTIARVGNARAWTDTDVERLRRALAARAARRAARLPSAWSSADPDDLAIGLATEDEHDESGEVLS